MQEEKESFFLQLALLFGACFSTGDVIAAEQLL